MRITMSSSSYPSPHLSEKAPPLTIPIDINWQVRFEAQGPGGLRLALHHNLTDFSYYIIIVIMEGEIVLKYATTILSIFW